MQNWERIEAEYLPGIGFPFISPHSRHLAPGVGGDNHLNKFRANSKLSHFSSPANVLKHETDEKKEGR